jgi:hypothetical protein
MRGLAGARADKKSLLGEGGLVFFGARGKRAAHNGNDNSTME